MLSRLGGLVRRASSWNPWRWPGTTGYGWYTCIWKTKASMFRGMRKNCQPLLVHWGGWGLLIGLRNRKQYGFTCAAQRSVSCFTIILVFLHIGAVNFFHSSDLTISCLSARSREIFRFGSCFKTKSWFYSSLGVECLLNEWIRAVASWVCDSILGSTLDSEAGSEPLTQA